MLLLLCVYNFVVDIFCDVVGWSVGLLLLILFQLVFLYIDILNRTKRENLWSHLARTLGITTILRLFNKYYSSKVCVYNFDGRFFNDEMNFRLLFSATLFCVRCTHASCYVSCWLSLTYTNNQSFSARDNEKSNSKKIKKINKQCICVHEHQCTVLSFIWPISG